MTYSLSLYEISEFIVDCEHKTAPLVENGIPSVRTTDLKNGRIILESCNRVCEETYKEWTNRLEPQPDDLVLSREAPVGEVGIVPANTKLCLGQRTVLIRLKKNQIVPRFLLYLFLTDEMRHELISRSEGSVVPHLNMSDIRSFPIPGLPSLPIQHAIARILGSLDDKIELNRQMNETLEAMARAIFQSWFVDFDPVRAKAEGLDTGLPPEVAALFPNGFEEVEGRGVPMGWRYCRISDVVGINEKSIDQTYPHSTIEYIEISSVTEGKLESVTVTNYLDAPSRAQRLVNHGDTIWSGVRPNRKSYLFIQKPKENLVVSTGFITLSPKKILPSYLYSWVTTELFVDYLTANADGSAYPAVRAEHFGDAEILLPAQPVLEQFEKIVAPMRSKKHYNDEQSRTLAQIRDALLPKLMSGDIQVEGKGT
jgi:type I restriction enzyme S subunit